jgi:anthranilate phosphoribosyltransferase
MKYAGPPRREIGIRTVFNILGPLTNPAFAEYQLKDLLNLYCASYADPHFFFGTVSEPRGQILINGKAHGTARRQYLAVYNEVEE